MADLPALVDGSREPGWVFWHRRIRSSPDWLGLSLAERHVLLGVVEMANFKRLYLGAFGGQPIYVERGELAHAVERIATYCGVSYGIARKAIDKLQLSGFLRIRWSNGRRNRVRVLTVVGYERFQTPSPRQDNKADNGADDIGGDRSATSEEGKKGKNISISPSRAPKVQTGRHASVIALFCRLWKELRGGGDYNAEYDGKDGTAAKRLLKLPEATDAEIERRLRIALSKPWFRENGDLPIFVKQWAKYDGAGGEASAAPLAKQVRRNPLTGDFEPTEDYPNV